MALETFDNQIDITDLSIDSSPEAGPLNFEQLFTESDWAELRSEFGKSLTEENRWTFKTLEGVKLLAPEKLHTFLGIMNLEEIGRKLVERLESTITSSELLSGTLAAVRSIKVASPEIFRQCTHGADLELVWTNAKNIFDEAFKNEDVETVINLGYSLKVLFPQKMAAWKELEDVWFVARDYTKYEHDTAGDIQKFIERAAKIKVIWPDSFAEAGLIDRQFWREARDHLEVTEGVGTYKRAYRLTLINQLRFLAAQEVNVTNNGIEVVMDKAVPSEPLPQPRKF